MKFRVWKNAVLLIASIFFYAFGEPVFVFIMIGVIIINWLLVLVMYKKEGKARKLLCVIAVIIDLSLLIIYKYLTFIVSNLSLLFKNDALSINIILPIGISFFTFQMMSYVFDVYYKKSEPQKNLFNVMLYISFFPQLIAGPIVRYDTVAYELTNRKENFDDFSQGVIRFTFGLGKKVLLADLLSIAANTAFAIPERSVATAWLGAICYTMQIYFDFSGYSDMAIGIGRIFGFHFTENFNYPFIAKSITEFWRREHISLCTWFRDYVYIPLGGNRVGKGRWLFNIFLVWLLTGIWHGANWTFVVWGMFYYVFLMLEKVTGYYKKEKYHWFSHVYMLAVVIIARVIFKAATLGDAFVYIGSMFGIGAAGFADGMFFDLLQMSRLVLVLGVIFSMPVYPWLKKKLPENAVPILNIVSSFIIFSLSIISCVETTYQPFIYFNF